MKEYHKIQSVFKRDENTHKFIIGDYSLTEFHYLEQNDWIFTEKIDGTNIRIYWNKEKINISGRTDNAQISTFLYDKLNEIFTIDKFQNYHDLEMTLYGEGFGHRIQKGDKYIQNSVDFILFDVYINGFYLERQNIENIAKTLQIQTVPIVGKGTLLDMVEIIKNGLQSQWGNFLAEGIVARPEIELFTRQGDRIITKIKHKDLWKNLLRKE